MDNDNDVVPLPWRWAVTTYSFTNELMSGTQTPDELVAHIARSGVADSVEVDAAQHFSSFPAISVEQIRSFRQMVDDAGVTPTMMGGYRDLRIDHRGPRSKEDDDDFILAQLRAASEMGFFGVRVSLGSVTTDTIERLLPELERLDIALLEEVQGSTRPGAPAIDRHRELKAKLDTDRMGFVFDASLVMTAVPVTWAASLLRYGMPQSLIGEVEELWLSRDPHGWQKSQHLVARLGLPSPALRRLAIPFRRFGCGTVAEWSEFLGEARSIHLKYWDLDDEGDRVSGPSREIRDTLLASGFAGFVCSEWGGHEWLEADEASAFDMTRQHRAIFEGAN